MKVDEGDGDKLGGDTSVEVGTLNVRDPKGNKGPKGYA